MSNIIITPNMNLPNPVPSVDPGPDWATNIYACNVAIDQHTHASGTGVQITPSGLNINSDLTFNSNNATTLRSARFSPQSVALAGASDLGCLYEVGVDLYYNDGSGNQIRITQSGSVAGATGTITGLPSGTASASFAGGAFTFQSATATPATMNVGPLVIGRSVASSVTVTLSPSNSQVGNFNFTFPSALPAGARMLTLDASGNLSTGGSTGVTGTGNVVLDTAPTITNPTVSTGTLSGVLINGGSSINGSTVGTSAINTSAIQNGCTVDNSVIGGITPAAATFTQAKIGVNGAIFKTFNISGTNLANSATLILGHGYTTFFGAIGVAQSAGTTTQIAIGTGPVPSPAANAGTYFQVQPNGDVLAYNLDTLHSNTFNATVFFI